MTYRPSLDRFAFAVALTISVACFNPKLPPGEATKGDDGTPSGTASETASSTIETASSTSETASSTIETATSTIETVTSGPATDSTTGDATTQNPTDPDPTGSVHTTATSDEPTSDSTTTADPSCGNGILDGDEECDNGDDNGDGNACTADCLLNICGDGVLGPDEACDDGDDNAAELGACAPDCSRVVEPKQIVLSGSRTNPSLGANPVATADGQCEPGYRALFVHGTTRRATTQANTVVNPIDWVLRPYTYYYNAANLPIWLTDEVPLLGVRDGQFTTLENPIVPNSPGATVATGLARDWTTLTGEGCAEFGSGTTNCNGWQTNSSDFRLNGGIAWLVSIGVINNGGCGVCSNPVLFYCIEQ